MTAFALLAFVYKFSGKMMNDNDSKFLGLCMKFLQSLFLVPGLFITSAEGIFEHWDGMYILSLTQSIGSWFVNGWWLIMLTFVSVYTLLMLGIFSLLIVYVYIGM